MTRKSTYEELEQKVKELERESIERKQAEQLLRQRETMLQHIADNLPVMFTYVNTNEIYLFVNKKFEENFKQRNGIGKTIREVVGQDRYEEIKPAIDAVLDGKAIDFESSGLFEKGDQRYFRRSYRPEMDEFGNVKGIFALIYDITEIKLIEKALKRARDDLELRVKERTAELVKVNEQLNQEIGARKRTEDSLRESEVKYRTLFENAGEAIFVAQDGKIKFLNPKTEELLGYSSEELTSRPFTDFIHEKDQNMVLERHKRRLRGETLPGTYPFRIINKDGDTKYVELNVVAFSWEDRPATLCFLTDITERHKAEEEQKKLEGQLQQAQKIEAIGTLAGGIAHNFNNLLMGIMGNASLVLMDLDSNHPHYKNLENIEKQVQNGSQLTRQLLGYARKGKYEVKPISLNHLVKETSCTFGTTRKEIKVHQELAEKLYGIKADQGQIEQVLLNLYVNAADAMPGGGDLFLKTMNVTHQDMTAKPYEPKPGNYVLLTVRDTGEGMDKETMERIFEPFFTTKGLAEGTGLGLASTYGIIKAHGGYIDVDSEKEKGTTFEIYLPATKEKVKEKKELSGDLVMGKETVLLVDDEEIVLDAGEQMLKKLGYEVLSVANGQEALELYMKNRGEIDMVLLDMVMPGMGGGEAYDRMKEANPNVKVLLSSGYSIEGEAKEILNRGCDGFIQKPFNIKELSQKLREILDKEKS